MNDVWLFARVGYEQAKSDSCGMSVGAINLQILTQMITHQTNEHEGNSVKMKKVVLFVDWCAHVIPL